MLKVGRCTYDIKGNRIDPVIPTFTNIIVLMKSSLYWELSPYYLKDANGYILENKWQFSKVYEMVPKSIQTYSSSDKTVIWNHPEETHIVKGKLTQKYWNWRKKGMSNKYSVMYPVGYNNRKKYLYSLKENNDGTFSDKLDYIQARKEIYIPEFCNLVRKQKKFSELKTRLEKGENLLIVEVNGPHQESLPYYIGRYNVNKDFFINGTVDVTEDNMKILLNDQRHNFGHGYCLGMALLNKHEQWLCGSAPTFEKSIGNVPKTIKNRIITAISNLDTSIQTKPKEKARTVKFDETKREFNSKLKRSVPQHISVDSKLEKSVYTPLTTKKEYIIDESEYDILDDLNSMIRTNSNYKSIIDKKIKK